MMYITLGIIGTAGRKDDAKRLTKDTYQMMLEKAVMTIQDLNHRHYHVDELVSGGAAWSDHIAVSLFRRKIVKKLTLCLPSPWNSSAVQFVDSVLLPDHGCDANTANYYHRQFSKVVGFDSLAQLDQAIASPGCTTIVGNGFKARNSEIAKRADAILAMTFGSGHTVKPRSGTADTMRKWRKLHTDEPDLSYHLDLHTIECFRKAA